MVDGWSSAGSGGGWAPGGVVLCGAGVGCMVAGGIVELEAAAGGAGGRAELEEALG